MNSFPFHDDNISQFIDHRSLDVRSDINHGLQMHSSLVRRLSQEKELEGHQGCVNAVSWNSSGSLLISGSDDTRINIWSYSGHKLLHSVETGHTANIFCTKFVPETSDDLVVSGAGDAEVRLFHLSRLGDGGQEESAINPSALFQCHTRRVKKLAVEAGNPHVVWSASEDGTLRQHDLREGASCPPIGSAHQECRNILLDLRCGAKKSLSDTPKQTLALKSFDISSTRPHLLVVGGSDAFARLYDRRMLPPLSSSMKKLSPPPCVNYFCPMHLSDRGSSSLHLTHVAFSPDGDEVLLNYCGEHVYLMDLNPSSGSAMRYTSEDAMKLMSLNPILNGVDLKSSVSRVFPNGFPRKRNIVSGLDKCRKLVQIAEKSLKEGTNCYYAIEACNEVLDGHGHEIGSMLMHECLCLRASLLLKRNWKNDAHMAIRDCQRARKIDSSSFRAFHCISKALSQLRKHKEALDFAIAAEALAPSNSEIGRTVESIRQELAAVSAESEKNKSDDPRSEREDSDYDEELELDFQTSTSGDEVHDTEADVVHQSINLRIPGKDESAISADHSNGSFGSPTSQNDGKTYQPEVVIDMKQRYVGHCNVGTDIKQASFLGQRGDYVASGSDDGRWFIWEKRTGRLIKVLVGDEAVVNCVQCHPFDCAIATSGIDNTIKIWTPSASVPSIVAGGAAGPETADVLDVMESNQRRLCRNRESVLPFELLERFRMHEFTEGTLHPFECTQS
ncbi:WD and tetratricopeptide repeats protein 1 [Heracleum sosnowskyi]|uniref:WD and tetratricopeptide repeats protein 1 n=1 Tax=Heracleum sosnowskyi TaxID=360622 RepID=A0AAD8JN66_9APIA|nr:WD and tetratricopeptide repeats protein 1 [Heracleum sosnowskyi]